MSAPASTVNSYARSSGQPRRLLLDSWIIGPVCALLLIGLVMVASASIGISEKETGAAFHSFTRQLVLVALGPVAGRGGLAVPAGVVLRSLALRRVMLAFLIYVSVQYASWVAVLLWAYDSVGPAGPGLRAPHGSRIR